MEVFKTRRHRIRGGFLFPFSMSFLTAFILIGCEKTEDLTEPSTDKTCPDVPTVSYDGKTYTTVQIGTQCWLDGNIDAGIMISGYKEQTDNDTLEKYCYNNDPANCTIYGGLYQWNEAMRYTTSPGTGGICPPGWHIPTFKEYQTLSVNVSECACALKAVGQGTRDGIGTNASGFQALLAGFRDDKGFFAQAGSFGFFWSSTEYDFAYTRYMELDSPTSVISLFYSFNKRYGFSVRCLRD
jgi:uncharacterized protein (TIGR02145 family)